MYYDQEESNFCLDFATFEYPIDLYFFLEFHE